MGCRHIPASRDLYLLPSSHFCATAQCQQKPRTPPFIAHYNLPALHPSGVLFGVTPSSLVMTETTARNSLKLCQERFRLTVREIFFTERLVRHWHRLQGSGGVTPSLEVCRDQEDFGAASWVPGCQVSMKTFLFLPLSDPVRRRWFLSPWGQRRSGSRHILHGCSTSVMSW